MFPRFSILLMALCPILVPPAQADVNAGGGFGRVGALYSFNSIGSPFATGLRAVNGGGSNRTGLIPVLAPWHITPGVQDTDGDGMSDAWETANGLNPGVPNANADADLDGMDDYSEFVTGTHPGQADSRFTASANVLPGNVQIQCPTLTGRKYRIERSLNLSQWDMHEEVIGDGSPLNRLIPVSLGQTLGFYRIIVSMYRP